MTVDRIKRRALTDLFYENRRRLPIVLAIVSLVLGALSEVGIIHDIEFPLILCLLIALLAFVAADFYPSLLSNEEALKDASNRIDRLTTTQSMFSSSMKSM
jgi:hypothetical protein